MRRHYENIENENHGTSKDADRDVEDAVPYLTLYQYSVKICVNQEAAM
ncbi:MAG: hypothetical protein LBL26_11430 [Peptococcaceae bacterium]|nr:hypothetical protein [Peptococcaceae bacterium]